MQARHGQKAAERTGPERTEPPERDDDRDPAQVVRDVFGDGIAWERGFRHHQGPDGTTIYVDETTGQVYDELPRLNPTDGIPEDLPRKR